MMLAQALRDDPRPINPIEAPSLIHALYVDLAALREEVRALREEVRRLSENLTTRPGGCA